jgi:hypothetical protein
MNGTIGLSPVALVRPACARAGQRSRAPAAPSAERKGELEWALRATCVPHSYQPGQEAQVDWYEAGAKLSGEQVLLQVFSMRSMASGAAFHRAYHRATQQVFLDAH